MPRVVRSTRAEVGQNDSSTADTDLQRMQQHSLALNVCAMLDYNPPRGSDVTIDPMHTASPHADAIFAAKIRVAKPTAAEDHEYDISMHDAAIAKKRSKQSAKRSSGEGSNSDDSSKANKENAISNKSHSSPAIGGAGAGKKKSSPKAQVEKTQSLPAAVSAFSSSFFSVGTNSSMPKPTPFAMLQPTQPQQQQQHGKKRSSPSTSAATSPQDEKRSKTASAAAAAATSPSPSSFFSLNSSLTLKPTLAPAAAAAAKAIPTIKNTSPAAKVKETSAAASAAASVAAAASARIASLLATPQPKAIRDSITPPFVRHAPAAAAAASSHSPIAHTSRTHRPAAAAAAAASSSSSSSHGSRTASARAASASSSAALDDFHYSVSMSRVLSEKDDAYEALLTKYHKLKAEKRAELGALLEDAKRNASGMSQSATNMVDHWSTEVRESAAQAAASSALNKQLQEQLTQREATIRQDAAEKAALAKQVKELNAKLAAAESTIASTQSSLSTASDRIAALSSTESSLRAQVAGLEKSVETYMVLTAMQVRIKASNGWANCKIVNPAAERSLEFDLDVDGESEMTYAPRHVSMHGVGFPSWVMEGCSFGPESAPDRMQTIMASMRRQTDDEE